MNAEYIFLEGVNLDLINTYAAQGYQVIQIGKLKADTYDTLMGRNVFTNIAGNNTQELITDSGTNFYIDKNLSYGDLMIITFLSIFLILGIISFMVRFFIPKFINFKK